jgi:hypothetical protein
MKLLDLHLGRPITRGGLTLFPVWNGRAVARPEYDLHSTAVRVDERAGSPVVGELVVANIGERPALVLAGELLEGGQQHRVAARSIVVEQGDSVVLDVHCVEQGRWSGTTAHARSGRRAPTSVRARDNQGDVWRRVAAFEQTHGATATGSVMDATRSLQDRAAALVQGIEPLPFSSGVLIGVGGQPLLLEVFDSPETLAAVWQQLLQAAAVDALDAPAVATPGRRARRFVERLSQLPVQRQQTRMAGRSPYGRLDALVWRDRAVHTVAANVRHELVSA